MLSSGFSGRIDYAPLISEYRPSRVGPRTLFRLHSIHCLRSRGRSMPRSRLAGILVSTRLYRRFALSSSTTQNAPDSEKGLVLYRRSDRSPSKGTLCTRDFLRQTIYGLRFFVTRLDMEKYFRWRGAPIDTQSIRSMASRKMGAGLTTRDSGAGLYQPQRSSRKS